MRPVRFNSKFIVLAAVSAVIFLISLPIVQIPRIDAQGTALDNPIAFRDGDHISLVNMDGTQLALLGNQSNLTFLCPYWSNNRKLLAAVGGQNSFDLYVLNPDGSQPFSILSGQTLAPDFLAASLAWSPDDKQIAVISQLDGTIKIIDLSGHVLSSFNSLHAINLDWSPVDQALVVFGRDTNNVLGLYIMHFGGSIERILEMPETDFNVNFSMDLFFIRNIISPHWSPDGTRIVFASSVNDNLELYTIDRTGSNLRRLTQNAYPDYSPSWSSDGQYIVYVSEVQGVVGLYVRGLIEKGTGERKVTSVRNGGCPSW